MKENLRNDSKQIRLVLPGTIVRDMATLAPTCMGDLLRLMLMNSVGVLRSLSIRGKEIQKYVKGEMPKQTEFPARKEAPIRALQKFLNDQKVPRMESPHELAQFLFDHPSVPSDWNRSKLLTQDGKARKDPAIIIAGEDLKFSRYFKFVMQELERRTLERRRKQSPRRDDGNRGF